jgi:hypothetical protein
MLVMSMSSGSNVLKLFTIIIYECLYEAKEFVHGKLLQPSLIFVSKSDYLIEVPFRYGKVQALAPNIRLGCKALSETHTLA